MKAIRRIAVFCGSSPGAEPEYGAAAERLGRAMIEHDVGLVYGGASVGLMGRIATTMLAAGAEVIGVIPDSLVAREVALKTLPDLRVVGSMHERKALMADLSDGFIALPGGLGTLEEFFEVLTWAQLGMHGKPCGLLNVRNYFDKLIEFLDHAVDKRFVKATHRAMVLVDKDADALLRSFERYEPPRIGKWSDSDRT